MPRRNDAKVVKSVEFDEIKLKNIHDEPAIQAIRALINSLPLILNNEYIWSPPNIEDSIIQNWYG